MVRQIVEHLLEGDHVDLPSRLGEEFSHEVPKLELVLDIIGLRPVECDVMLQGASEVGISIKIGVNN